MQRAREKMHNAPLTNRERLTIFYGSSVDPTEILKMEDCAIDFDFMMRHGVRATALLAAGVGPSALKTRGVATARMQHQAHMPTSSNLLSNIVGSPR